MPFFVFIYFSLKSTDSVTLKRPKLHFLFDAEFLIYTTERTNDKEGEIVNK